MPFNDTVTRLEISVDGEVLTPIESFTPTINTPVSIIHSIEADNVAAVCQPQTATFSMSLEAIGSVVATLTKMALEGTKFSIQIAEKKGDIWTFKSILFRDCIITSANPSNITRDGVPKATFNGSILGFDSEKDYQV